MKFMTSAQTFDLYRSRRGDLFISQKDLVTWLLKSALTNENQAAKEILSELSKQIEEIKEA